MLCGRLLPIHIDKVRDGLEGVETDTDGQCDGRDADMNTDVVECLRKEPKVFEDADDSDIDNESENEGCLSVLLLLADDHSCEIVEEYGKKHQEHIDRFSPGIEDEGEENEYPVSDSAVLQRVSFKPFPVDECSDKVENGKRRNENEKEEKVRENHVDLYLLLLYYN